MRSIVEHVRPGAIAAPLRAFQGCGIELEYALVSSESLDVDPIADAALRHLAGSKEPIADLSRGMFGWSNELVLHVLELKNSDPTVPMELLASRFQFEVREMNRALATYGTRLMPSGMHPWMDPGRETQLWPHQNAHIYRAYDRIFGCRSHGYANLQSMHLNLPFADDEEFARLHDAVRMVVPILPAIAASSPFAEGRRASALDYRMSVYRSNCAQVPQLTGALVPERCASAAEYRQRILQPMYQAIAPHDADGIMRHEWLNSRGAIARFDRNAIEIRVLDTQECPRMDVGVAALVMDLVQSLCEQRQGAEVAPDLPTPMLCDILTACIRDGEDAEICHAHYLRTFGVRRERCQAAALWESVAERLDARPAAHRELWRGPLRHILARGTLARRLLANAGRNPTRKRLRHTYQRLCDALHAGVAFD